jgi:predicted nucleic acid-binding protein
LIKPGLIKPGLIELGLIELGLIERGLIVLVLDCSVAVAWCFDDEATPPLDTLLDHVQHEGAIVPSLWTLEITNVLLQAGRGGRIAPAAIQERFGLLDMLPIETDAAGTGPGWRGTVLALATADVLTTYDATYLELAIRRGVPLATTDRTLRQAATRHGLTVLPA